ncbi:phospholipase A and acyltransferase 1-like [Ptychodera flava]|uniref:phospholipase A and acyltransferase 1-like n=1 Tax=Ptychodera flava TaxID=63121 RepID=UPI003969DB4E
MNLNKTTKWMSYEELLPEIRLGDIVEIKRPFYAHASIVVDIHGKKITVVHVDGNKARTLVTTRSNVHQDPLEDVYHGDDVRINNGFDKEVPPSDVDSIVEAAKRRVGQVYKYHLIEQNCQHFATQLRYNDKEGWSWESHDLNWVEELRKHDEERKRQEAMEKQASQCCIVS